MRGGITRSRNGCAVCKKKRLKCDEGKPSCTRCKRMDIVCPGYKRQFKWAGQKHANDTFNVVESNDLGNGYYDEEQVDIVLEANSSTQPAESLFEFGDLLDFGEQIFDDMFDVDLDDEPTNNPAASRLSVGDGVDENESDGTMSPISAPASSERTTSVLDLHSRRDSTFSSGALAITLPFPGTSKAKRTSTNQLDEVCWDLPLKGSLTDSSSVLVEYYFKEVAGLFSCYDSRMNPFRTTVSRLWASSPSIYYTVQSMAAACLADVSPHLLQVGLRFRSEAASFVEADVKASKINTGSLLALIMLGLTASWHDPNNLGQAEFDLARVVFDSKPAGEIFDALESNERNLRFFQESLIYWEMLLSYVSDDSSPAHPIQPQPAEQAIYDRFEPRVPHPWTGVGCDAQLVVFEVGSLVRKERNRIRRRSFTCQADIEQTQNAIHAAKRLELKLRALAPPVENVIVNPGDDQTPVTHFLKIAEAYRCAGLLQLYCNFPDLLNPRRPSMEQLGRNREPSKSRDDSKDSSTQNTSLTALALHIVDLLREIPISSRTKCVQPFLLVAVTSELQLHRPPSPSPTSCPSPRPQQVVTDHNSTTESVIDRFETPPTTMDVLQARKFVLGRLSAFEHILPAKPIRQMTLLVTETWARMDDWRKDVYWMDVMIEKGYETMMG